jgi:hypothetical protein
VVLLLRGGQLHWQTIAGVSRKTPRRCAGASGSPRWVAVGHHGGCSDVVHHVMLEGRKVGQRKQIRAVCCKLGHRHAGRVEVGQVATEVRRVGVEVGELRQFCIELRQERVESVYTP